MLSRASLIAWCAPLWLIGACGESRATDEEPARRGAGAPSAGRSGSGGRLNGGAGRAPGPGGEGGSPAGAGGRDAGADVGAGHGGEAGMRADGGTDSGGRGGQAGRDTEPGESGAAGAGGAGGAAEVDCDRIVLARGTYVPDLAVEDSFVYWLTRGTCPIGSDVGFAAGKVSRIARDGSGAPLELAKRLPCPQGIAVHAGGVFWSSTPGLGVSGTITAIPSPGAEPRSLTVTGRYPTTVVADDDSVYWAEVDGIGEDGLYRSNRTLTDPAVLLAEIVNTDGAAPHQLVLDDEYAYWADRDRVPDPGLIQRVRKEGGIPQILATAVEPRELAISSRGLFWIEEPTYDEPIISMLDWSDIEAAPRVIASAPGAWALAARGDAVYWITGAALSASIYRVRIGEPEPELLVEGERMLGSLTVDDHYLYWASGDPEHRLNRMCR